MANTAQLEQIWEPKGKTSTNSFNCEAATGSVLARATSMHFLKDTNFEQAMIARTKVYDCRTQTKVLRKTLRIKYSTIEIE
jgi:hypothetical protein